MGNGDTATCRGGELAFIERLRQRLPLPPPGQYWIGDDAAVLEGGSLLKTDVLVESVHFDFGWCRPEDVGWKAMAVNLSDIAAMGGSPTAAVVSLVVRTDEPGTPDRVMDGMAAAGERFACPIVGGDTSIGPALVVSVAVVGQAHPSGPVLRSEPDRVMSSSSPGSSGRQARRWPGV
ncbi:MAG: thiamine-monophosphate kinase [Actinomycetia bacterium]|nr:thiamine-monophosphate kinase [Actinomycetes bacterium]